MIVGGTDARFYRAARAPIAYGAALFSPDVTFESFGQRFHGNDERIDVESLGLCGEFLYGVSKRAAVVSRRSLSAHSRRSAPAGATDRRHARRRRR